MCIMRTVVYRSGFAQDEINVLFEKYGSEYAVDVDGEIATSSKVASICFVLLVTVLLHYK